MAHAGGNFGPNNSMKSFKGAIAHKIDGLEFDVWLSRDKIPVILHGGQNGELEHFGRPKDYIFE